MRCRKRWSGLWEPPSQVNLGLESQESEESVSQVAELSDACVLHRMPFPAFVNGPSSVYIKFRSRFVPFCFLLWFFVHPFWSTLPLSSLQKVVLLSPLHLLISQLSLHVVRLYPPLSAWQFISPLALILEKAPTPRLVFLRVCVPPRVHFLKFDETSFLVSIQSGSRLARIWIGSRKVFLRTTLSPTHLARC